MHHRRRSPPGPCAACGADPSRFCNGTCVDLTSDVDNCGACGNACPAPANGSATCTNGSCGVRCDNGFTACNGACLSIATDVNNCGSCGNVCAGDACNAPACTGGVCGTTPLTGAACTVNGAAGACNAGACVEACTTIVTCATSADCESGQSCQNGACFTECFDLTECSQACADCICSGSTNSDGFYCHDLGFGIGACQSNADCPAGSVCDAFASNGAGSQLCTRPCRV